MKEVQLDSNFTDKQHHRITWVFHDNLDIINIGPTNLGYTNLLKHYIITSAPSIWQTGDLDSVTSLLFQHRGARRLYVPLHARLRDHPSKKGPPRSESSPLHSRVHITSRDQQL